ncbi:MAG: carboxypeptidase regulatory-like domain-containing protein [Myxococcaceae bacterium]|nr:carboxypeptidase regulatory-like domain-containing protein [Myxococcaceae bacterium]
MSSRAGWAIGVTMGLVGLGALWLWSTDDVEPPPAAPPAEPARAAAAPRATAAEPPTERASPADPDTVITLSGVVVDEAGAPVPGAKVVVVGGLTVLFPGLECAARAWMPMMPGIDFVSCGCSDGVEALQKVLPPKGDPPVLASTETDAEGKWSFDGVPRSQLGGVYARKGTLVVGGGMSEARLVLSAPTLFEGRVVDDEGRRVAGARVWVIDDVVTERVTDEQGHFEVSRGEGPARVIAHKEGLLPDLKAAGTRFDFGAGRRAMRSSRAFASDVALELTLAQPIQLTGQVLYQGQGVEGVEVTQTTSPCAAKVSTDGRGNFVMRSMREQRYSFEARKGALTAKRAFSSSRQPIVLELEELVVIEGTVTGEDGAPLRATLTARSATSKFPQGTAGTKDDGTYTFSPLPEGEWVISVESATARREERKVELKRPRAQVDFVLSAGATVSGRAVDVKGDPVPGVWLRVYDGVVTDRFSAPHVTRPPVTVKEGGAFVVQGLEAGDVTLVATAHGWEERFMPVKAPATNVELVLTKSACISGAVKTKSGASVDKANVTARRIEEGGKAGNSSWSAMAAKGRYEITGMPAARYEVSATAGARKATPVTVEVQGAGQASADLVLPDGASISGVVVDELGRPLAGAVVSADGEGAKLVRSMVRPSMFGMPGMTEAGRTGPDGRFRLDELSADAPATLVAMLSGYEPGTLENVSPNGAPVRVVLKERGAVTGRVLGERGALNRFTVNGEPHESADGRFRVDRGEGSALELVVQADGYAPHRRTVTSTAAKTLDVGDVVLSRGVSLSGRVVDTNQRPVYPVNVQATVGGGRSVGTAQTDTTGRFFLDALPDEDVTLTARPEGYLGVKQTVRRGAREVELVVGRGWRLAVQLVDQRGSAMPNVRYTWSGNEGRGGFVTTDAEGRFELSGLAAGELELRPFDVGGPSHSYVPKVKLQVERDGQAVALKGSTGGVTVRVKAGGAPSWELRLEVRGESAPREGRYEGGAVTFSAVPPGTHRLLLGERSERTKTVVVDAADVTVSIE